MLIKSECQALDKTRHKPAWNLFEQHESRWPGRFAARRVRWTRRTVLFPSPPSLCTTSPERQTGRCGGIHRARLFRSLSRGASALTLGVNRGARRPRRAPTWTMPPSKSRRQSRSWRRAARTHVPVCNYGEQRSALAVWKTINGKSDQRRSGVDPSAALHNSNVIKGEFWRREIIEAGCYLTDECLGSATVSVENYCFPTQNFSRLPKYDKRLM